MTVIMRIAVFLNFKANILSNKKLVEGSFLDAGMLASVLFVCKHPSAFHYTDDQG